jgi:hypothetical protein
MTEKLGFGQDGRLVRRGTSRIAMLPMSVLGHDQTPRHVRVVSVIPLKADIHQRGLHVRLVPLADMRAWAPQFGLELAELG